MNPSVILLYKAEVGKKSRVLAVPMEMAHGSEICIFRAMLLEQRSVFHTVEVLLDSRNSCSFAGW